MLSDWEDRLLAIVGYTLLFLVVIVLFVGLPYAGYHWYKEANSPTFMLKKADWKCTAWHAEEQTIYVQTGKVMLPITTDVSVCDVYVRRVEAPTP